MFKITLRVRFQSTPPVKAATSNPAEIIFQVLISIHAAREGGDGKPSLFVARVYISIHAAREGGDGGGGFECRFPFYFNPRRP